MVVLMGYIPKLKEQIMQCLDGYTAKPCENCGSYAYHGRTCPKYVDLAREENKRAIIEDIEADFDREPDQLMEG